MAITAAGFVASVFTAGAAVFAAAAGTGLIAEGLDTGGFAATEGFAFAGAAAFTGAFAAVLGAAGFAADLTGAFAGCFDEFLEPAALGATFAVLFGIALLFFEDATVLPTLRASFFDARARLFVALRPAATAFFTAFAVFDGLEADEREDPDTLFERVF